MKIISALFLLLVCLTASATVKQDSILVRLRKKASAEKNAETYLSVSEYLIKNNPDEKLIELYLDSSYHAAQKEKSDLHLGMYYNCLIDLKSKKTDVNSQQLTVEYGKKALAHFHKAGIEDMKPYLCTKTGIAYFLLNKVDSAIFYFKDGLQSTYDNPDNNLFPNPALQSNLLRFLTISYKLKANNDSTLYYAKKHEAVCISAKDSATLVEAQYNIATTYDAMGRYAEALEAYLKAAKTAVAINDNNHAYSCYSAASTIAEKDEKLNVARLALKYAELAKDTQSIASSWGNIGNAYINLGETEEAIKAYRKSVEYYDKSGNKAMAQVVNAAIMELYAKNDQHDSAWAEMQKLGDDVSAGEIVPANLYYDSIQSLKTENLVSGMNASTNKAKFEVMQKQYLEQENKSLKQRIILISALAVLLIVALLLLYNRQRQKHKAEQVARYAKEKEAEFDALQKGTEIRLTRKYIEGLESERERIAKELHDGVCNDLLALEMNLKQVSEDEKKLRESLKILTDTRTTVRNISHELMPPVFQYESIHEMLLDYTTHIDKPDGMQIHYKADSDMPWITVPQHVAYEIYRIIQELLSNSIKHSKATKIDITLALENNILGIEVADNGVGFDKDKKHKGIGLYTVTERIKSINGNINISNSNGTRVGTSVKLNEYGNSL